MVRRDRLHLAEMTGGSTAKLKAVRDGYSYLTFHGEDGTEIEYYITVSGGSIWADLSE